MNITNVSYVFFGNNSVDTYLYRSGTNTLQTASTFIVPALSLGWGNLTAFPSACSSGQFVTAVGSSLTCGVVSTPTVFPVGNVSGGGYFGSNATQVWYGFSVPLYADQINSTRINSTYGNFSSVNITSLNATNVNATTILAGTLTLGWENLTTYPSACPAGQAITAVGDILTCGTAGGNGSAGWTAAGSRVYNDTSGTTVGIGTNYPNSSLHIVGGTLNVTSGNVSIKGTNTGIIFPDGSYQTMSETNVSQLYGYDGATWRGLNVTSEGILRLDVRQAISPGWVVTGSTIYNDTAGVRLGIGTASPIAALDVVGNLNVTGRGFGIGGVNYTFPTADGSANQLLTTNGAGSLSWSTVSSFSGWTASGGLLYNNTATAVGIGTTAPVQKLDVVGNINATGAVISGNANLSTGGPNLVLNSDFGRRNKWMTFMPEVFSDTSGFTIDGGGSGSVSGNILTTGTLDANSLWQARFGLVTWRDVRMSAQFKATDTTKQWLVIKSPDTATTPGFVTDGVWVRYNNGNFLLEKRISGSSTTLASVAQSLTTNNWYWLELEAQGSTYIAKIYSSGSSPVAKSSATLLQTLSGTASDASVVAGYMHISSTVASTAQWGNLSTGDGGVYVEGWGPESWTVYFNNTMGGQAVSFNETADSGPIGKQWAFSATIPAANRTITLKQDSPDGSIQPSTAYTYSSYWITGNKGGSGDLLTFQSLYRNSTLSDVTNSTTVRDAGETSWTRAGVTTTTGANVRRVTERIYINQNATATGNVSIDLLQLDQGSIVTPWRNAPADDGPIVWQTTSDNVLTTTSGTSVEIDPRDLALNLFLPWDAKVRADLSFVWKNSASGNINYADVFMDAATMGPGTSTTFFDEMPVAFVYGKLTNFAITGNGAAGKHRLAAMWSASGGTATIRTQDGAHRPVLIITATRGK